VPIRVVRGYDSRDKRSGDFGVGWRLGLAGVRLGTNGPLGAGWRGSVASGFPSASYCREPARWHGVTVTLPDGRVERFAPRLDQPCQDVGAPAAYTLELEPQPGTRDRLVALNGRDLITAGNVVGPVDLLDPSTFAPADPTRYQLTLQDGTGLVIDKVAGLQQIV